MEYFDRNPLAALKKPARTHRDACPTREQWDEVMAEYKDPDDPFYGFLGRDSGHRLPAAGDAGRWRPATWTSPPG